MKPGGLAEALNTCTSEPCRFVSGPIVCEVPIGAKAELRCRSGVGLPGTVVEYDDRDCRVIVNGQAVCKISWPSGEVKNLQPNGEVNGWRMSTSAFPRDARVEPTDSANVGDVVVDLWNHIIRVSPGTGEGGETEVSVDGEKVIRLGSGPFDAENLQSPPPRPDRDLLDKAANQRSLTFQEAMILRDTLSRGLDQASILGRRVEGRVPVGVPKQGKHIGLMDSPSLQIGAPR